MKFSKKINSLSSPKIIIIGAGIAGISAFNYLKKIGVSDVTILESRERSGGRILTSNEWGFPMDMGPSWLQSTKGNPLIPIAKKMGIKLTSTPYRDSVFYDKGKKASAKEMEAAFDNYHKIYKEIKDRCLVSSAKDKLSTFIGSLSPVDFWAFKIEVENEWGAILEDLGSLPFYKNEILFDTADFLPSSGITSIFDKLKEKASINYGQKVLEIQNKKNEVVIKTESYDFSCDFCIITVPLGVLKKQIIKWTPDLPIEKKEAISKLKMGLLNKFYCYWEKPWWNKDKRFLGINDKSFPIMMNIDPINDKVLLLFSHGKNAEEIEKLSNEETLNLIMKKLRLNFNKKIEKPDKFSMTKWGKDSHTYGSYSYFPVGTIGHEMDVLAQPWNRVFFAGESTNTASYGYLDGAFKSGIIAAKKILKIN